MLTRLKCWNFQRAISKTSLNPRGLTGRIYVGEDTLLHTKYISCGSDGFREDLLSFSHYKSVGVNDLQGMANLDPKGVVGKIYVRDH